MEEVLSSRKMLDDMKEYIHSENYLKRLKYSETVTSVGRVTVILYLLEGGRKHPRKAQKLGSAFTLSTRVLDDLLDGDGCPKVEKREEYLQNYLKSFKEGVIPEPAEVQEEKIAYQSAKTMHDFFIEYPEVYSSIEETMKNMLNQVISEDKTQLETYYSYVEGAGADFGEILAETLQTIPDFNLQSSEREFIRECGRVTILLDHIVDNDVTLEDAELKAVYKKHLNNLRKHSLAANIITRGLLLDAPEIYRVIARTDRILNRVKGNLLSHQKVA